MLSHPHSGAGESAKPEAAEKSETAEHHKISTVPVAHGNVPHGANLGGHSLIRPKPPPRPIKRGIPTHGLEEEDEEEHEHKEHNHKENEHEEHHEHAHKDEAFTGLIHPGHGAHADPGHVEHKK